MLGSTCLGQQAPFGVTGRERRPPASHASVPGAYQRRAPGCLRCIVPTERMHPSPSPVQPLPLPAEADQEPSKSESESETSFLSSSDSESDDDSEGRAAEQAAALASKAAAAAEAKRRRQEEAAERAAAAEVQKQRQLQEAVDAEALRLAALLPQQAQQAEQQEQEQQQGQEEQQQAQQQQAQQPDEQQQGAAGPVGAAPVSTKAITSPGPAHGGWRRPAQQLQKHAGRLPWRTAPAPGKPAAGGAGSALPLVKPTPAQAAARDAAEVQALLQGCCTPSPKPLAVLLRAICGCTQVRGQWQIVEAVHHCGLSSRSGLSSVMWTDLLRI